MKTMRNLIINHHQCSAAMILFLIVGVNYCLSQTPYQASIRLKINSHNATQHICNGVIVHASIILSTADCIQGSIAIIEPSLLLVYAGNPLGPMNSQVTRTVKSIEFAQGHNGLLENDLAVLKLNEPLPLDKRLDIQWIMIGDPKHNITHQSCSAIFTNGLMESHIKSPIFTYQYQVNIENEWKCMNYAHYSNIKRHKICSYYVISAGHMCNATSFTMRYTTDRGTPLVCGDYVYGILSSVIAPSHPSTYNINCHQPQPRIFSAYYTRLTSYSEWIYRQMSGEKNVYSPQFTGIPLTSNNLDLHYTKASSTNGTLPRYNIFTPLIVFITTKIFM